MHFSFTTLCSVLLLTSVGTLSALALPAPAPVPAGLDSSIDPAGATTRPIMPDPYCFAKCSSIPDEVCAENKKKQQRTFVNACQLGHYNCLNPQNRYEVVREGACDTTCLPIP
ncbi:MAG: hypothetical protein J3R72DRAFT_429237 [Linnemannia gamsii]|nr:MAG: hypothetical protein J3R72DRAFT_429237 [Linnemannia gamsii]